MTRLLCPYPSYFQRGNRPTSFVSLGISHFFFYGVDLVLHMSHLTVKLLLPIFLTNFKLLTLSPRSVRIRTLTSFILSNPTIFLSTFLFAPVFIVPETYGPVPGGQYRVTKKLRVPGQNGCLCLCVFSNVKYNTVRRLPRTMSIPNNVENVSRPTNVTGVDGRGRVRHSSDPCWGYPTSFRSVNIPSQVKKQNKWELK